MENARTLRGLRTRLLFIVAVVLAATFVAGPTAARAQSDDAKARALKYYNEGNKKANLGKFDDAIKLFEKGYEEIADASFLFNIAQAYRQWGKCKEALFFYKRFMLQTRGTQKPRVQTVRTEVENHIKKLESRCKQMTEGPPHGDIGPGGAAGKKPGAGTKKPDGDAKTPGTKVASKGDDDDDDDDDDDTGGAITERLAYQPTKVNSSFGIGPAFLGLGDLEVPAQFTLKLGAGYPLQFGKIGVDVGGMFTFTPVPWDNPDTMTSGTATLTSLLLNGGATYAVNNKIGVRGEFGLGMLIFSGLEAGNVFTEGGAGTSGGLSMFNIRMAVTGEYAITDNIVVTASPVVFSYSPAKEGLREDISSLTRFELMVGAGYRL